MRKTLIVLLGLNSFSPGVIGQDSLKTTTLTEVVVTGTKFDVPMEKSGKTIFKLSKEDLEKNSGKSLADLLNEIPGIQTDGNFGTLGTNVSYYVRGGRNRNTLILIDGVPLNDPSAINAEYDLRYIPVSQIESVEVLKGGLSTLYGTNAAAGVINITLKKSADKKISAEANLEAGSFNTYSETIQLSGTSKPFRYFLSGGNISSEGFSAAQDNDPARTFDKDGFERQNILGKFGFDISERFKIDVQSAYEKFSADFDAFEFADAKNTQKNNQLRLGLTPQWMYEKGNVQAKLFVNWNEREYFGDFPSELKGTNFQGEMIHRHNFSNVVSLLSGLNYQRMSFDAKDSFGGAIEKDDANMYMIDPYSSVFVDFASGFNLHAGIRLNTHSVYGSKFVYNVNPGFLLNKDGAWNYKIFSSVSTSYITPTLYQLYSPYGNLDLAPEEAVNYEVGFGVIHERFHVTSSFFQRDETSPIDFSAYVDDTGNFAFRYENTVAERTVTGFELALDHKISEKLSVAGNISYTKADKPATFYKIPKTKFGVTINGNPARHLSVSLKYNFTGDRTSFDFAEFEEVSLDQYQLVDLFVSYGFINDTLTLYGAVNNLFDEEFVALYGYTTRGRNFNAGIRYRF
jgi:vitamin B12 transporter